MGTTHDGLAEAGPHPAPTDAELLTEGDAMELDLATWLAKRGRKLANAQRVRRIGAACLDGLGAPAWRALILIWGTSPDVRSRYSADSRGGLLSAAESMDDATLLVLVRGLLEEARTVEPLRVAA